MAAEGVGDFGGRLREVRQKAGCSQEALAQLVGVDRVTIARIEAGAIMPKLELAGVLGGVLSRAVRDLSAAWKIWFLTGETVPDAVSLGVVRRRDFIRKSATAAAMFSTLPSPMIDLERLAAPPLDAQVLNELESMTAALARTRPMTAPRRWLMQGESHLADLESRLREGSVQDGLQRQLVSLIGSTAALCAWVSLMAEQRQEARAYMDHGEAAARQVGDLDVVALLLMLRSDLLSGVPTGGLEGFPEAARAALDEAMALTSSSTPISLRAPIYWRAAEEYAYVRDERMTMAYLLEGQNIADSGAERLHPLRPFWGGLVGESFRGSALQLLGRSGEAIDTIEPLCEQGNPWHVPLLMADLGSAHAQRGDVAAACEMLGQAADRVRQSGLSGAGRRILGVRSRRLDRYRNEPAVRTLDKKLSGIL